MRKICLPFGFAAVMVATGLLFATETRSPLKEKPENAPTYSDRSEMPVGTEVGDTQRIDRTDAKGTSSSLYVTVTAKIPERKWLIGGDGWFDSDGYNLEAISPVVIASPGETKEVASPLADVVVNLDGRERSFSLVPGDIITHIDDKPASVKNTLYIALQSTRDPQRLKIRFQQQSTGQNHVGHIRLVPAR